MVKSLQFKRSKIRADIEEATNKNSIYYRAAKPYLDAKRTLVQIANYEHLEDITVLYNEAKERLDRKGITI